MRHPLGSCPRLVRTAAALRNRLVRRLAEPGLSFVACQDSLGCHAGVSIHPVANTAELGEVTTFRLCWPACCADGVRGCSCGSATGARERGQPLPGDRRPGGLFGPVASVPTVWRTLAEIASGVEAAAGRLARAVTAARRRRGRKSPAGTGSCRACGSPIRCWRARRAFGWTVSARCGAPTRTCRRLRLPTRMLHHQIGALSAEMIIISRRSSSQARAASIGIYGIVSPAYSRNRV
jgi:hypothetical protein